MQSSKKFQYSAIFLSLTLVIVLAIFGFNSNTPKKSGYDQKDIVTSTILEAINNKNVDAVMDYIEKVESGAVVENSDVATQISAYEYLLGINKLGNDSKVRLAELKFENVSKDEDVMAGVRLLLEVVKADSNNIKALEALGERSIQSGQLKKAKERYQKLLNLQPENDDYRQQLESINRQLGNS